MAVPFLDLKRQYEQLRREIEPALMEVCASQYFILGPVVEAFEKDIAAWIGVKHAIGCSSGTDALLLCLMALDVGPGDEVITTPFTFFATAGSIWRLGATIRFADIDHDTFNIAPEAVEQAVTDKTKVILPVHLYGQCADVDALDAIAAPRGIQLVEDACQAIGATYKGRGAGAMGACAGFSFYPTKNLGGFGEGGLVTTDDDALATRLRALRAHGSQTRYFHEEVGFNARFDALQAAALQKKLPYLETWNARRREIAAQYDALLEHTGIVTPVVAQGNTHIFHQYVIRVKNGLRDQVAAHLSAHKVGNAVFYPLPLHMQPCFASLGYGQGDFPESEQAAKEVLALPVFPELTAAEIEEVAQTIREVLG